MKTEQMAIIYACDRLLPKEPMKTQIHITYQPIETAVGTCRARNADTLTLTHDNEKQRLTDIMETLRLAFAGTCHPPVSEIIIKPL